MSESVANIETLKNLTVVPEFECVCPSLTEDEFTQLEENILSDGEVTNPLIIWNNSLIDGHHRRKIILNHPEIPFRIKRIDFNNKYEAIAWICKNQTGRRNLTQEQLTYLIGKRYEAEKQSVGAPGKDEKLELGKNYPIPIFMRTSERVATENGISEKTVRLAGQYAKGTDAAEEACPGARNEILSGALKLKKNEVIDLSKIPTEQVPEKLAEYRREQEIKRQIQEEKRRQAEIERQARKEKRRQAEEVIDEKKTFSSISEVSASLAEPKRRNNVSNVIGIISDSAEKLQATCEAYILKNIFWDMNVISSSTRTKTENVITETDDGNGNIVETTEQKTRTYLHITVTHKTVDEMATQYGFNATQKEQLGELLSDDKQKIWNQVLFGITGSNGDIVSVALTQIGNVGGEPYWRWYGFNSRVEWCACFVSWCANQCGYIDTGVCPKYAGCRNGVQWFKDRNRWLDNSATPEPGMIIFFDWNNKGSSGPQDGQSDHVGIVQKVENGIVYTVEGNSGDSCRQNQYSVGHYEILGYGVPQY